MGGLKRILLAEDSPEDVELTLSALSEHRLANEVVTVGDGAEALDYLYKRGRFRGRDGALPSVVLLDIKMPKVDGLEVLRHIRSDPQMANLPVVMLTSSREERDIAESYEHHVNAYVVKPVAFPDFVEAIKSLGLFWAVLNEPPPTSERRAA
ncbi:MAG TPA: response regulator [Candidatus Eisenbacteria bacterium]|jgi:CheY-like chemotaxis protein